MKDKLKVAFICVHNSCRSQIAEALGKKLAANEFDSYSAGSEISKGINEDAIRIVKEIYGIDMKKDQYPKLIDDLPDVDLVITMGCNVTCPIVDGKYHEDWGLEDPTAKSDEDFIKVIKAIEENIIRLKKNIKFYIN